MTFQMVRMKEIGENIKKYYIQHKWVQYAIKCGLVIGILMLVMPFVISSGYTYLCEDDYSFEGGALDAAEQYGEIKGAFKAAHRYYRKAQGTYFANMVWHIVRPYMRWGMPGFHAMMIANMIVFIWALSSLIMKICKEKIYGLCVVFLTFFAIWGMSDTFDLRELLFWYTGTVNFTWVLSFSMLTLTLQLRIKEETDKRKRWILAGIGGVTALIGSGGALMITAIQCAWLLLVLVLTYDEIREKKMIVFPFLFAFGGALWNTCAPGNFARVAEIENAQQYTVWNAIVDTWMHWKDFTVKIFGYPLFVLILAIVFVITFVSGAKVVSRGITHLKMFLVIVGVLAMQYLTAFPVMLGYCGLGLINMRTSATYELVAKITFIFGVMCVAQWSRENIMLTHKILPAIAIVVIVFGLINVKEIEMCVKDGYAYNITKELLNGTIRDNYKVRESILARLDSAADGEDVFILANPIPKNKTMYGMGLMEDPNSFVNISAAGLFRLNSVTVEYE